MILLILYSYSKMLSNVDDLLVEYVIVIFNEFIIVFADLVLPDPFDPNNQPSIKRNAGGIKNEDMKEN